MKNLSDKIYSSIADHCALMKFSTSLCPPTCQFYFMFPKQEVRRVFFHPGLRYMLLLSDVFSQWLRPQSAKYWKRALRHHKKRMLLFQQNYRRHNIGEAIKVHIMWKRDVWINRSQHTICIKMRFITKRFITVIEQMKSKSQETSFTWNTISVQKFKTIILMWKNLWANEMSRNAVWR